MFINFNDLHRQYVLLYLLVIIVLAGFCLKCADLYWTGGRLDRGLSFVACMSLYRLKFVLLDESSHAHDDEPFHDMRVHTATCRERSCVHNFIGATF